MNKREMILMGVAMLLATSAEAFWGWGNNSGYSDGRYDSSGDTSGKGEGEAEATFNFRFSARAKAQGDYQGNADTNTDWYGYGYDTPYWYGAPYYYGVPYWGGYAPPAPASQAPASPQVQGGAEGGR